MIALRFRNAALALSLLPRSAIGPALGAAVALAAPAAHAQADAYKLHMENGVKLYNDKNFPAAIAEFSAAYDARPGPNPLVNIALCEKELYRYHRAIAALETALAKHGAAMSPGDRKASEDAIKDMRALLGTVTIKVTPADAALRVDGEDVPVGAAQKPIELGPGTHKIEARAPGHASAERTVRVTSGQAQDVVLDLVSDNGLVTVQAPDARMTITIDQRIVGTGSWSGMLAPGPHLVEMTGPGAPPHEGQIVVVAGKPLEVRAGAGVLPKKEEPSVRRGIYLLATGSILFPLVHSPYFINPKIDFGAAFGVRVGFQVNNVAGFDLAYQHSSITTYQDGDTTGNSSYRLISERVALGLRLTTPGKMFRFVATIAGGLVYDQVQWGPDILDPNKVNGVCDSSETGGVCLLRGNVHGFDAFGMIELLAELDIDRVLINLGVEGQFQSTGNIGANMTNTMYSGSIYGAAPIINIGPALRVGYRFW